MKTTIKTLLLAATASVVTACNMAQPAPQCAVGHGGFGAKFTYVSGDQTGDCFRRGDIIGVQKYRQTDGSNDIYLKSEWLAEDEWLNVYPSGELASGLTSAKMEQTNNLPVDDFCTATAFPAATGTDPNGVDLTYQWSNVRFYVTGTVPGTQFAADLTITGPACSTTYTVDALYPVVTCGDENGENADDAHCEEVDHHYSHLQANPRFAMTCEPIRFTTDQDNALAMTGGPAFGGMNAFGEMPLCLPSGPVPSILP